MSFVEKSILNIDDDGKLEKEKKELELLKCELKLKLKEIEIIKDRINMLECSTKNVNKGRDSEEIIDLFLINRRECDVSMLIIFKDSIGRLYNFKRNKAIELCKMIRKNSMKMDFVLIEDLGKYQFCKLNSDGSWTII